MKIKLLIPIAALAVSALTVASLQAVKLSFAPKAGASAKYKLNAKGKLDMGGQAGEFTFSTSMTQKVASVADGKVVIESEVEAPKITFDGQEVPAGAPASKNKSTYDLADGRTLESINDPADQENPRLDSLNQLIFPKAEVKDGESWTAKVDADAKKGTKTVEFSFTYQGREKIGAIDCFKIGASAKETDADSPMTMTATYWVDATGMPVKVNQMVRNVVLMEGLPPTDMESNLERVTD